MRKKVLMTALLCVATLGGWAQSGSWSDESNRSTSWGSGYESATTLTISNAKEFAQFAYMVNDGKDFGGKTVTLDGAIDLSSHYWTPIGKEGNAFNGTFDGNGKTISCMYINEVDGSINQGLFGVVNRAGTVQNLKLADSNVKADMYVGGIVGQNYGTVTNCLVGNDVTIEGFDSGSARLGGIAGFNRGTITGCMSKATLKNAVGMQWGGIAGNNSKQDTNNDKAVITDCLFCGSFTSSGNQWVGAIVGYQDTAGALNHNFYYGCTIGEAAAGIGKGSNSSDAPEDVTDGASRVYAVTVDASIHASITFNVANETTGREYAIAGITVTDHSVKADDVFRAVSGNSIQFPEITTQESYTYNSWAVKDNAEVALTTESSTTSFTMPAQDVVITATEYVTANMQDWITGDGTATHPYLIETTTNLNTLATKVNSGTDFSGKIFLLANDLAYSGENNYTPIGDETHPFRGIFNGGGHTVSGLNVQQPNSKYIGLFGNTASATIKNVSVTSSTFQGMQYVGAIAGCAYQTTIENCHAGSGVTIPAYTSYSFSEETTINYQGGIAGSASNGSSINGCSSCANFSLGYNGSYQKYAYWGGIVGYLGSSTVKDCLFYGDRLITDNASAFCAVAGYSNGGTITNNYYVETDNLKSPNGYNTSSTGKQDVAGEATTYERLYIYSVPASFGSLQRTYGEEDGCVGITVYESGMTCKGLFFGHNQFVVANDVTYIDATGAEQTVDAYVPNGNETVLDKEWYVVNDDVTFDHPVTISHDVNLILADGKTMMGVSLKSDVNYVSITEEYPLYNLTIYGQSAQTGVLSLSAATANVYVKDFVQNGGQITLDNTLIAGSQNIQAPSGNITINRGKFTSTGTVRTSGAASLNAGQIELNTLRVIYTGDAEGDYNILLSYEENDDYIKVGTYEVIKGNEYLGNMLKIQTDRPLMDEETGTTYTVATRTSGAYDIDGKKLIPGRIKLADDADNTSVLAKYLNRTVNVVLQGRKLWKGEWNTISLPFYLTKARITGQDSHPLQDADIRSLQETTFDNGTLTLTFTNDLLSNAGEDQTVMQTGTPYLVKPAGDKNSYIENPEFKNVLIQKSSLSNTDYTSTTCLDFMPNFTPYEVAGEDRTMLYLGADNKLYYPTAAMTINSFRGYFKFKGGITAGDLASGANARRFVLNFGDGDESTGILSLSADSKDAMDNATWYTLDGRRLTGKPSRAGIYINNGKKIVIK